MMQKRKKSRKKLEDRSIDTKFEYIMDHIYFTEIFLILLDQMFELVFSDTCFEESYLKLIVCMILPSAIGIALTFQNLRNVKGTFTDIISGIGLYVLLTFGVHFPKVVFAICAIMSVATVIGLRLILCPKIKNKNHKSQIIRRRLFQSCLLLRRNVGIASILLIVIIIPVSIRYIKSEEYTNSVKETIEKAEQSETEETGKVVRVYGDEYSLKANIDLIKNIRSDDLFQKLSYEEKCDLVKAIIYCEARYLGLCKLEIKFDENLSDETLGKYQSKNHTILINAKMIRDGSMTEGTAKEVLKTCLHECRHCYQNLLVALYLSATPEQKNLYAFEGEGVEEWVENLKDYKNAEDNETDYDDYRYQPLEVDANEYALLEMIEYYREIDELLGEE